MILLNEEITLHATFVTFVVETSRSQKKNIFKTSSPSHSYSHSYSCIVGRGICLFCAHSQFFFLSLSLSIELAPDHLVDHPATDTPVCPSLSGRAETQRWASSAGLMRAYLTALPMNTAHILGPGVTHKEMWHLKPCFLRLNGWKK